MRRYEAWIKATQEELRIAVEAAEEAGWHHLEGPENSGDCRRLTYQRLLTWESEITRRVEHYDATKPRR